MKKMNEEQIMYKWPDETPEVGKAVRIVGDAQPAYIDGETWRWDEFGVEAPFPDNYPPPTPVDCVEIKTYPEERQAVLDSRDLWFPSIFGQARCFWHLFNHISKINHRFLCPVHLSYTRYNNSS